MSGELSKADFEKLLKRLSQADDDNLSVGNTSPFPSLAELEALKDLKNCSARFSKAYRAPMFLKDAGASGGKVYLLEAVGEQKRLRQMGDVVNKLPLIVKKSALGLYSDEENFMDIVIGTRLNILVATKIAPGFMRTVDWFVCHDFIDGKDKSVLYSIIERQDIDFDKYLLGGPANMALNRSILGQLLYNMEAAQESLGYVHYDLHVGNVFARVARDPEQLAADFWSYRRANGQTMWISADDSNRHEPVIIDFGRNRIRSPLFTMTGRPRTGRAAGTEVLSLSGFENVGISSAFHRQWDMRRFSTYLVEALLQEQYELTRERTARMRERSGRSEALGPPKDYFQRLFIQSQRAEYAEFMEVLDEMSGHKHVKLRSELKNQPTLLDRWDYYHAGLREYYRAITSAQIDTTLREFRKGGIRQLMKWARADAQMKLRTIEMMWSWTEFTFDATPASVLDMPFFQRLYVKPRSASTTIAEVAVFKKLVDVGPMARVQCARDDCVKPALLECEPCQAIGYCSDSCANADWAEHQLHCSASS